MLRQVPIDKPQQVLQVLILNADTGTDLSDNTVGSTPLNQCKGSKRAKKALVGLRRPVNNIVSFSDPEWQAVGFWKYLQPSEQTHSALTSRQRGN